MKKIISLIMAVAVLAACVSAYADGNRNGGAMPGGPQQGQMGGSQMQLGQMNGQMQNGQMGGSPENTSFNGNSSNERPADVPGMSEGERPDDVPEMPEGERPDGAPGMDGRNKAAMIDFDAMVTDGVISQETLDSIMAYMEENRPEDMPEMNGEAPAGERPNDAPEMSEGEKPDDAPEMPKGGMPGMNGEKPEDMPEMGDRAPEEAEVDGILKDFFDAGIITQDEYDALVAALSAKANENAA